LPPAAPSDFVAQAATVRAPVRSSSYATPSSFGTWIKRNPHTNLRSAKNYWDFWTSLPEALHPIRSSPAIAASRSLQGIKNLTDADGCRHRVRSREPSVRSRNPSSF
jgi:hypothetical protein